MTLHRLIIFIGVLSILILPALALSAEESEIPPAPEQNLLRDTFYLGHSEKMKREVFEVEGFSLVSQPAPDWNSGFSVITGFKGNIVTTHVLRDVNSTDDARKYFDKNVKTHDVDGVIVRELSLKTNTDKKTKFFWVGNRAFRSLKDAKQSIGVVKNEIEKSGGDFEESIRTAGEVPFVAVPPEEKAPTARGLQEEELLNKMAGWMGFDRSWLGPFYGVPSGETILYQSTFETTYRSTNLSKRDFNNMVGYFSNRLVFKGLRSFNGTTVDPFIEAVPVMDGTGTDYASYLQVAAGLEWRFFANNIFLQNYQPYGLPVLDWMRNLRAYIKYAQNKNIKGQYEDWVKTYDFLAGVSIFKEWGIDLPSVDQYNAGGKYFKKNDFLWGELYGDWAFNKTNFTAGDNLNCFLAVTAFKVGVKFPRFPLPDNPINEEMLVMPYFLFENANNSDFSRYYQNYYFHGWGVRWMPFRDYRFANNEWLFKTKIFFEYIENRSFLKGKPPPDVPNEDCRLGINVSFRRF